MRRQTLESMRTRGPLRKVLETVAIPIEGHPQFLVMRERLDCGHLIRIKSDKVGPTNAARRRCYRCAKGVR